MSRSSTPAHAFGRQPGGSPGKSVQSNTRDGKIALRLSRGDLHAEQWSKETLELSASLDLHAALQEQAIETLVLLGIPPGPVGAWYEPPAILLDTSRDPATRLPVPVSLITNNIDTAALLKQYEELYKKGVGKNAEAQDADALISFKKEWGGHYNAAEQKLLAGQPLSPVEQMAVTIKLKGDSLSAEYVLSQPDAAPVSIAWAKQAKAEWESHAKTLPATLLPTQPVQAGQPKQSAAQIIPKVQSMLYGAKPHDADQLWSSAYLEAMQATGNDPDEAVALIAEAMGMTDDAAGDALAGHLQAQALKPGASSSFFQQQAKVLQKNKPAVVSLPPLPNMAAKWLKEVDTVPFYKSDLEAVFESVEVANGHYGNMQLAIDIVAKELKTTPTIIKAAVIQYHQGDWIHNDASGLADALKYFEGNGLTIGEEEISPILKDYYTQLTQAENVTGDNKLTAADLAAKYGGTAAPGAAPKPASTAKLPKLSPIASGYVAKATNKGSIDESAYMFAYQTALGDGNDPATAMAMLVRASKGKYSEEQIKRAIVSELEYSIADPSEMYFDVEKQEFRTQLAGLKAIGTTATPPTAGRPPAFKTKKGLQYATVAGQTKSASAMTMAVSSAFKAELDDGADAAEAIAMIAKVSGLSQEDVVGSISDYAESMLSKSGSVAEKHAVTKLKHAAVTAMKKPAPAKPAPPAHTLSEQGLMQAKNAKSMSTPALKNTLLLSAFKAEVNNGADAGAAISAIARVAGVTTDEVKDAVIASVEKMKSGGAFSPAAIQEAEKLKKQAEQAVPPTVLPPNPPRVPKVKLPATATMLLEAGKTNQVALEARVTVAYEYMVLAGDDPAIAVGGLAQYANMSEADVKAMIVKKLNEKVNEPALDGAAKVSASNALSAISAYTPMGDAVGLPSAGLVQTLDHILVDAVQLGVQNGVQLFEAVNIGVNWQLANVWAQKAAQSYAYGLVADINATTVAKLQKEIGDWVAAGKPLKDLQKTLLNAGIWDANRANLIAVTEVTRAYEMGSLAIYNQVEGVEGVEWATSKDRHVCRICEPMNGKAGKLTGEYPGGMRIPSHPGCRCWSRPVVTMPDKPVVKPKPKPAPPPPKLVKGTSGDLDVDQSAHLAADAMNFGDKDAATYHYVNAYKAALKKTNFDGQLAVEMLAQASGAQGSEVGALLTAHYAGIMANPAAKGYAKTDAKAQLNKLAGAAKPYIPPKSKPAAKPALPPAPPPVVLGTSGHADIDKFAHQASKSVQAGQQQAATMQYLAGYKEALKRTNFDGPQAVNMLAQASGMPPESITASLVTHYQSLVADPAAKGYAKTDAKAQLNKLAGVAKPYKGKKAAVAAAAAAAPAASSKPTKVSDLPALDPITMRYVDPHEVEPTWAEGLGANMKNRYGGVVFDDEGRILLREPSGHHDGYWWTFPKGGMDSVADNPFDTALREVAEETGHQGEVIGMIPGAHKSGYSASYFYMMRSKGHDPKLMDSETQTTKFVSYDEAKSLIMKTTNEKGRERDLKLLDAAFSHYNGVFAGATAPAPPMPAVKVDANKNVLKQEPNGSWLYLGPLKLPVTKKSKPAAASMPKWSGGQKPSQQVDNTPPASGPTTEYGKRGVEPPRLPDRAPLPIGRKPQASMDVSDFPSSLAKLEQVRELGGSTGAKLMKDPATGKLYVYKKGASAEHVRSEAWADTCYHAMGVPVPRMKLYEQKGGPIKLSEYIEGTTLDKLKTSDPKVYAKAVKDLQKNFAADALMGNWDVAGMSLDNVLVSKDGTAYRIDNGGSLAYRAQGDKKKGMEWAGGPVELYTMRANSQFSKGPLAGRGPNAGSVAVFGDLSYEDAIEGAWSFVGNDAMRQALFDAVPDADVAKTLVQRWDTMRDMATAHERLKADKWKMPYVEGFTYHTAGMTSYGVFDKLPKFLVARPGSTQPVDQDGRPFDHLRGKDSLMFAWEKYVKDHGGQPENYAHWGRGQGRNSWDDAPQAVKVYMVNQRNVPSNHYYWRKGEGEAKKHYNNLIGGREAQYDATFQPLHAMNYAFLTKTNIASKDEQNGYLRLMRTENRQKVLEKYGLNVGETKVIKKGAVESTSIYTEVYVEGDSLTQQWVPIERVIGSYFFEAHAGQSDRVFLGDHENELVVMMEGLPTTFSRGRW